MKKLLIIQKDDAYFLYETLQVLDKNLSFFRDYQLTILVNEEALRSVFSNETSLHIGLTTDSLGVSRTHFDVSVNLSLSEDSWDFHGDLSSDRKIGIQKIRSELMVDDLWSAYLLTLKARSPFLTFHLQDVYRNILGIKAWQPEKAIKFVPKFFAYGTASVKLFPAQEQENFLQELITYFPDTPVKDISEVDLIEDVSGCFYVGPATLEALKLADAGARCIFLSGSFQGFNLLPRGGGHLIVSSRGNVFRATSLIKLVEKEIRERPVDESPYSLYTIDHSISQTAYLQSLNQSDDMYPFYQSHVVLWSFLLNICDLELDVIKCNGSQLELLKINYEVLSKFIRLHDYAMISIEAINAESKSESTNPVVIEEHIRTLNDVDKISDQISASHPLLRPFLDFYRIRRGQNYGDTFADQAQNTLLTYAEEHQVLKALQELFSVTLRRNEVNI